MKYPQPVAQDSEEIRLGPVLGVDFDPVTRLGNALAADLDPDNYGIGWWRAYSDLDRKSRILISDHLVTCARAIIQNLLEAEVYKLELSHAIDDFHKWIERGVSAKRIILPPPRGPYDDLANHRVGAHLAGLFRSFASALDCLAACIVSVAALPTNILRADLGVTKKQLKKAAESSQRLAELEALLEQAEASAGPVGWLDWLLGMRNMLVHRGRHMLSWNIVADGDTVEDFVLYLPKFPTLSEVEASVQAGGYAAAQFETPHQEFLENLSASVYTYVNTAAAALEALWDERKTDPIMLEQPSRQWKSSEQGALTPTFTASSESATITEIGVSDEVYRRLQAAALTSRQRTDVGPLPEVWGIAPNQ